MEDRIVVCPNCHRTQLGWDDEVGQWYCTRCDMHFSDEDLTSEAAYQRELRSQDEDFYRHCRQPKECWEDYTHTDMGGG